MHGWNLGCTDFKQDSFGWQFLRGTTLSVVGLLKKRPVLRDSGLNLKDEVRDNFRVMSEQIILLVFTFSH